MICAISPALGMGEEPPFPYWIPICNFPATQTKANGRLFFVLFLETEFTPAVFQHSVIYLSRQPGCARTNRTSNKQRIKMKHAVDTCSHSAPAAHLQTLHLAHCKLCFPPPHPRAALQVPSLQTVPPAAHKPSTNVTALLS